MAMLLFNNNQCYVSGNEKFANQSNPIIINHIAVEMTIGHHSILSHQYFTIVVYTIFDKIMHTKNQVFKQYNTSINIYN